MSSEERTVSENTIRREMGGAALLSAGALSGGLLFITNSRNDGDMIVGILLLLGAIYLPLMTWKNLRKSEDQ